MPEGTPHPLMAALGSAWRGLTGTRPAQEDPALPPAMAEGLRLARREIPDLAPVDTYGLISNLVAPGAQAYTSPGRNIYLNPTEMAGLTPEEVADTLTHEQQHVKQMRARGQGRLGEAFKTVWTDFGPYGRRPDEMEAFQAEQARQRKGGRPAGLMPSFSRPDAFYRPRGDINLPPDTRPR